ncbi:MAG: hypothetical protein ACI4RO_01880, partial [Candidatus Scatosoma sp.]
LLAAIVPDGEGHYFVYLVNDAPEKINAELTVVGGTLDGVYGEKKIFSAEVGGCSSKCLGQAEVFGDFISVNCRAGNREYENSVFVKPFKDLAFTADYSFRLGEPVPNGTKFDVEATVRANRYARFLHWKLPEGSFADDDWFDVIPGNSARVWIRNVAKEEIGKIGITDYSAYVSEGKRK